MACLAIPLSTFDINISLVLIKKFDESDIPHKAKRTWGKYQPKIYWSCSSTIMKDATKLMPITHERNSIFQNIKAYNSWFQMAIVLTTEWCSTGRLSKTAAQALDTTCTFSSTWMIRILKNINVGTTCIHKRNYTICTICVNLSVVVIL